jgi:predicted nucleic acid-binding protein
MIERQMQKNRMSRYLLDTNIIRFYAEKVPEVEKFIDQSILSGNTFFISETVKYEIESQFVEMKKREVAAAKKLIKILQPIEIELKDFKRAHLYRRQGRKIRKYHKEWKRPATPRLPGLADSLIAIAALNEKINIITNNTKDFHLARFLGSTLYCPIRDKHFLPIFFRDVNKLPTKYE